MLSIENGNIKLNPQRQLDVCKDTAMQGRGTVAGLQKCLLFFSFFLPNKVEMCEMSPESLSVLMMCTVDDIFKDFTILHLGI